MGTWYGTGWSYSTSLGLYRNTSNNNKLLYQDSANKLFQSNKGYVFKTKITNLNVLAASRELSIRPIWESTNFLVSFNYSSGTSSFSDTDGYVYLYSSPLTNVASVSQLEYSASYSLTASGIKNLEIYENDWKVCGYSWINDGSTASIINSRTFSQNQYKYCSGWRFNDTNGSFFWYDLNYNGEVQPFAPVSDRYIEDTRYKSINYISKYIDLQGFNLYFICAKGTQSQADLSAGLKIYLSNTNPSGINSITNFRNYLNSSELVYDISGDLLSYTQSITESFLGLEGNRYLLVVGDTASATQSYNLTEIYLNIEGGYHDLNNDKFNMVVSGDSITKDIQNATFSINSGSGNSIDETLTGSSIYSKIGNGNFSAGIWENGVWNNGWREDNNIREFYNIDYSIKTLSDIKWRVRIVGPTSSVDFFDIGDKISVGNIIGIDINENRKLLKDVYTIINKSGSSSPHLDSRRGYIDIEIETTFPLRRVQIDSMNHRILITKNVWLSGAFFNGYFTGIWNYGLFKGYPLVSEMYKTYWVDGIFDGGHINSNYYISGTFTHTFFSNNYLGLSFSEAHYLTIGDKIIINKGDNVTNYNYNGEAIITNIINDYQVITNKKYGRVVNGETGSYTTNYRNSVIQNINLKSNNISKITSVESLESESVFLYNSWLDLVYDNTSAVNIGKPQTIINKISNKTYPENNLYGYPTLDVLSSKSIFRDSFSLLERTYNLGTKYKMYNDFIGDSSIFSEYFDTSSSINLFIQQGWTYSTGTASTATFSRTENIGETDIIGEELKISTINNRLSLRPQIAETMLDNKGTVLDLTTPTIDISNRSNIDLSKDRYTMVEFDLVTYSVTSNVYIPQFYVRFSIGNIATFDIPFQLSAEPVLHFNNINKIRRKGYEYSLDSTFLPIYKNINHLTTSSKKKVEYFYNKRNLSLNVRGNGLNGLYNTDVVLNNLKLYEVDMIPFFQYFTDKNINISVQIPFQGIAPFIDYTDANFKFLDNINIGLDSVDIKPSFGVYSGIGSGIGTVSISGVIIPTGEVYEQSSSLNNPPFLFL